MSVAARLPECLHAFPGVVLQLSPDGVILDSNGVLERALGRALVGVPFAAALDAASCGEKWERMLHDAVGGGRAAGELVLAADRDTLAEPRTFSVTREPGSDLLWVVEHPADPRLDYLREQVTEVNSELATTQRELLKERGRLARALSDLEHKHARLEATSAELSRSNRALEEFAHAVSHDLKAPLRGIRNYASWVVEDASDALPPGAREHLAQLMKQADRMRRMIDGVLQYARAGRAHEEVEPVNVAELLDDVVALLGVGADVVQVEEPMPTLVTARAPLQQVLLNLLDNAIKYARRADPRVRVSAREAGDLVEFTVADNGPGIPAALEPRIWGLFKSLEPANGVEHTGVGLAVVRRLVEAQNGKIWLVPHDGSGAIFRFEWRRAPLMSE